MNRVSSKKDVKNNKSDYSPLKTNLSQTQKLNLSSKIDYFNNNLDLKGKQMISFDSSNKSINIDYDLTAKSPSQFFT